MKPRHPLTVGLDIGTSKTCIIVAEAAENTLNVLGIGTHPSKGLRKGVIINIETTTAGIRKTLDEAELMVGADIRSVQAGISGGHIKSFNSHGMVNAYLRRQGPSPFPGTGKSFTPCPPSSSWTTSEGFGIRLE